MFTKKKRILYLFLWMLILSAIYWGLGSTRFYMPIMMVYGILCLILSIAFVVVNGGIRPIVEGERRKEAAVREKYLKDKGVMHPIKRRDKYRRFRVKGEEVKVEEKPLPPPPNPLKLPEAVQKAVSQGILIAVIPFYLIFLLDWCYVTFFC